MGKLLDYLKDRIHKPDFEPEYEEAVDHDIVMIRIGDRMVEVTADDSEEGQ